MQLAKECVELLLRYGLTVSTMESCTGGMVASGLVDVAGASAVFKAGYVTYSDEAKHINLGVNKETLEHYSAVSAEVAKEMVEAKALQLKPDVAISVTGIAGPDDGTQEKPVGLVYIGCRVKEQVKVQKCCFDGNRTEVRQQAAEEAMIFMKQCITEYFS